MDKLTANTEKDFFDINRQFESLLVNSQKIINNYDSLIQGIQLLCLSSPSKQNSLNLLITAYNCNISKRKDSIEKIASNFASFNQIYELQKQLNKYFDCKAEVINKCKEIIEQKRN